VISGRRFWTGVTLLLCLMAWAQVSTALKETQTWDEAFDLAAGYSYWKTGDFRLNREHPPVGKLIDAIPLLFMKPTLPLSHPSWAAADNPVFGYEFLYSNRIDADTLLFAGRAMTILTVLLAGLAFAIWMRGQFGPAAALIALTFFAFDPNLIAHGRYVTSDAFFTIFFFFACAAWGGYLKAPGWRRLLFAGLLTGLACASKTPALLLPPVFVLLLLVRWWQQPDLFRWTRVVGAAGALLISTVAVVALAYAPEAGKLIPVTRAYRLAHPEVPMLADHVERGTVVGDLLERAGHKLGLQAHPYLLALDTVASHNMRGHQSYLLGQRMNEGVWYYFPVVFAVKTPCAVLLALAVALIAGIRRWRHFDILWFALTIPPLVHFGVSMAARIDIGVRHILPVYPFLYVGLGVFLASLRMRWLPAGVLLLLAVESLAIYPHYLAFFNWFSGGAGNGPTYLVDSNIDWGQDVKKLRAWLAERGTHTVHICFFGRTNMSYYGLEAYELPTDDEQWRALDGFAAASVTPLQGVYVPPEKTARLRSLKPVAKVGYSIYVYDFRKGTKGP